MEGKIAMCPRIFHIYGPLWVNGYGLMIALGFLFFTCLAYRDPWRKGLISAETFLNVLSIGFISAVAGGRFLFAIFSYAEFDHVWEVFYPWVGGFSLFGSVIFVLLALPLYLRMKQVPLLPFFDLLGLYAPLLVAVSRIGCFLAGCCHGVPCHHGFCCPVTFLSKYSLAPLGVPLYPTQLFASGVSLLIFVILFFVARTRVLFPGMIILLYLMFASVSRFTIDFWRGDRGPLFYGLSSSQLVVLGLFTIAIMLFGIMLVGRNKARGER